MDAIIQFDQFRKDLLAKQNITTAVVHARAARFKHLQHVRGLHPYDLDANERNTHFGDKYGVYVCVRYVCCVVSASCVMSPTSPIEGEFVGPTGRECACKTDRNASSTNSAYHKVSRILPMHLCCCDCTRKTFYITRDRPCDRSDAFYIYVKYTFWLRVHPMRELF